ncbi:hypothetical protein [Nocardiopsis ganjiahuensis]|uniref:hypothetical protein n=1 Tax=Nocardiopsis ganjiahuensis TaxID=239984 RepID=UPI000346F119|nr:hypothetical protein [Nocardiopsis ganjiahuensis]
MTTAHTHPAPPTTRPHQDPPRALVLTTLLWAALYTALRLYWTLTHTRPHLPPVGDDLLIASDWGIITLGATTLALTPLLARTHPPRLPKTLITAAATTAALTTATTVLLLLDVVGLLLLNSSGIALHPLALATRLGALALALLLAATTRAAHRRWIADCTTCGRTPRTRPALHHTPPWAYAAAYLTIAAFITRLSAQALTTGPDTPITPPDPTTAAAAMTGLLLLLASAGILLPLALVHRFGRIWPAWVPLLAHRPLPRPLLLLPALFAAISMNLYFGLNLAGLILRGTDAYDPSYPDWFWWASIGSYVIWGAGLAVATYAYARRTRPACPTCQRR